MTKYIIVGAVILLAIAAIATILQRNRKNAAAKANSPPPVGAGPPPLPPGAGRAGVPGGPGRPGSLAVAPRPAPATVPPAAGAPRRHGAPGAAGPSAQPQAGGKTHWLVGHRVAVMGKTFHIGERRVTLGRGVSNFVQVVDDQVSRVHCQLFGGPAGLTIKDMASKTGTVVNGQKIDEYILQNGDQIEIGDSILEYWLHGAFTQNDALEKKESGEDAKMATQAVDLAGDMKQVAAKAVQAHNGDVRAAAVSLGVSAEFLMQVLDTRR